MFDGHLFSVNMMKGLKFFLLGLLHIAVAVPILTDLEMVDDTTSVGTYVREVRAAPVRKPVNRINALFEMV